MHWLNYFQHNRDHRLPVPWDRGIHVEPHLRDPLIRSLQRFQVGESGEGTHLRKQAASTRDATYEAAIGLFVKEEQEHARLMAGIIRGLGGTLLSSHWSDGCFILLRRLFGLHHELMVLLIPEIIAKRYFRALHDGTADPVCRAVFAQIQHDEEGHIAFHIDTLQQAFLRTPLPVRAATRLAWRILFRLACVVVLADHRSVLRACGVSSARFWWDCGLLFDEVAAAIFTSAPQPALTRPAFKLQLP